MSFDSLETSISGGRPIRLYDFQRGTLHWRYTNADRDVVYQTQTYATTAISDDGIRQTGETSADALVVVAPWNNPVARLFRAAPPSAEIELTIRDLHAGESEARIKWMGYVMGAKWPSPERAQLNCQTLSASFNAAGLRLGWERGCPYTVYDHNCKVSPGPFGVAGVLTAVTGVTIEAAAFDTPADGYFAGGYVEWSIGSGEVEQRSIESHVAGVLSLLGGAAGLTTGQTVTAYPGCLRDIQTCFDRFNNVPNYGGHPHLPGRNLFDGNPIV